MTNHSLAASQRPNISLIDRRLSDARRVPYRVRTFTTMPRGQKTARPIDSCKPYQRLGERRASAILKSETPLTARPFHLELDRTT